MAVYVIVGYGIFNSFIVWSNPILSCDQVNVAVPCCPFLFFSFLCYSRLWDI